MKILFVSLGCDKNLVDSERMIGQLFEQGYTLTDDEAEADVIVVNTCAFIDAAKEESIENILEMAKYKDPEVGVLKALIVTGCMAQRYKEEILSELPEVDAIIGTNSYDKISEAVRDTLKGQHPELFAPLTGIPAMKAKRAITTGGHYEYLKIAEGCNKHCTYCVIPSLRGPYRSVPMEELIQEAKQLCEQGTRELILVAQETSIYGQDLYGRPVLHELIKKLCEIPELFWIRVLYCYPEDIYPELIQTIKEEEKVCKYLDLPIQHADDTVLKRMGRRTSRQDLERIITTLRQEIPEITLRTTLITGFPGETEEQHENLMQFVNDMEFDRLGVFTYSQEEGTPAARMPGQINEEVKLNRQEALMELQQEISADLDEAKIGREMYVMIEGKVADEHAYVARSEADAPGIDGYVFVQTPLEFASGDFVKVRITGASEYDLIGEVIE